MFCGRAGTFIIKYTYGRVIRYCCVQFSWGEAIQNVYSTWIGNQQQIKVKMVGEPMSLLGLFIGAWMGDGHRDDSKVVVALKSYPSMPDNS